jgi:hypothetical protein
MNKYNEVPEILETGCENVSPHLRWLVRNAVLSICPHEAVNLIAYNKAIPNDYFGIAHGPSRSISINLEKHFLSSLDLCMKEENMYASIRMLLLHELLDTVIHEAWHLKTSLENNDFDHNDLDEKGAKEAGTKAWLIAKNWDCNITLFGDFLDGQIKEFTDSLEEDTKETPMMWKDLQVWMHKNNLGYYDPDKNLELSISHSFEALSKDEEPWVEEPAKFLSMHIEETEQLQPVEPTHTVPESQAYAEEYTEYEDPNPPAIIPNMASTIETVFRTMFWHVVSKGEFTNEGGYNNPGVILDPINIAHIPGASQIFTHMDTLDSQGKYAKNQPTTMGITGMLTKENLPKYTLFLNINGTLHRRSLVAQNPNAVDDMGNLKTWAREAQMGAKIMYVLGDHLNPGVRASIKLAAGHTLGQEEYKLWT